MASWKMSDISSREMEMELKRRNLSFDPKQEKVVPKQIEAPDFTGVCKLCQEYVDDISTNGWADDDFKDHIQEGALLAVFGPEIWEWIRESTTSG